MTDWITSDEHYHHDAIRGYSGRPFSTVDEMDEQLVLRFNARVNEDDITYHIGDFSLQETMVPKFLRRLNGTHILVGGNHDLFHPANRRRKKSDSIEEATKRYLGYGFKSVHLQLELDEFLLCHLPYPSAGDDRPSLDKYRPERRGNRVLIHGHIHQDWRYKDGQYNAGVDAVGHQYAPVSLDEVRVFLATNPASC